MKKILSIVLSFALLLAPIGASSVRVDADGTFNAVVGNNWYQTDVNTSGDAQGIWQYKLKQNEWGSMAGTYSGASGVQGFTFNTTKYGYDGYKLTTSDIRDVCGLQAYHIYDVTLKVTHNGNGDTNIHFSTEGGMDSYNISKQSTTISANSGPVTFSGQVCVEEDSELTLAIDMGVYASGGSSGCRAGTLQITEAKFEDTGETAHHAVLYDKTQHPDDSWDKTDVDQVGDQAGLWEYKFLESHTEGGAAQNRKGGYSGADKIKGFKFKADYGYDGHHVRVNLSKARGVETGALYNVSITVQYIFNNSSSPAFNIACHANSVSIYNIETQTATVSSSDNTHTYTGTICSIPNKDLFLEFNIGKAEGDIGKSAPGGTFVVTDFSMTKDTEWTPVKNNDSSVAVGPLGLFALFDADHPSYGHWGALSYKTENDGKDISDTTVLVRSKSGWLKADASWLRLKDYASNRLEPGTPTKATIVINSTKPTSVKHNDETDEDEISYLKVGIGDHTEYYTLEAGDNTLVTEDFIYNDQYSMDISFELDMIDPGTELKIKSVDLLNAVEPEEEEEQEPKVPVLSPDEIDVDDSNPTWRDEFNGDELDESKWTVQEGNRSGSDGPINWGNNEKQNYKKENITVDDGALNIEAKEEHTVIGTGDDALEYDYTSGRLNTKGKFSAGLGYVEARLKLSTSNGLWPAFWMLGEKKATWPRNGEIDILEQANENDYFQSTVHFYNSTKGNNDEYHTSKQDEDAHAKMSGIDFSEYHTYGVNRNGDTIAFYLDREKVYEYAIENDKKSSPSRYPSSMNNDYYVLLNLACGGNFTGNKTPENLPKSMQVDYVRYYGENEVGRLQPDVWTSVGAWDLYNGKDDWCDFARLNYEQGEGNDLGDTKMIFTESPRSDAGDKEYGIAARLNGYTVGRMNGYRPYKAKITLNSTRAGTLITNIEGQEYRLDVDEGDNVIYTDEFFHNENAGQTTTASQDPTDVYFYYGMLPRNTEIIISQVEFEEQPYDWTPVINKVPSEVGPWSLYATFDSDSNLWGEMSYKDISDVNDCGELGNTLIKVRSVSGWDTWGTYAKLDDYMSDRTLKNGTQYDVVITYYSSKTNNSDYNHAIVLANGNSFNLPLVACEDLTDTKRVNVGSFTYNAATNQDVDFKLDMLYQNTCLSIKYIEFVETNGSGDYDVEPYKQTSTYPKQDGKVFAGWYDDQSFNEVHAEDSGEAYPKFIDENVLTAKRQWKTDGTAIRFVSSIDTLDYQSAGFAFEGQYGEKTFSKREREVTKVYRTIIAGNENITPNNFFADESRYFFTFTIRNMDPAKSSTWTVTPFYVTADGTKVYGKTSEFTK